MLTALPTFIILLLHYKQTHMQCTEIETVTGAGFAIYNLSKGFVEKQSSS